MRMGNSWAGVGKNILSPFPPLENPYQPPTPSRDRRFVGPFMASSFPALRRKENQLDL